MAHMAERKAKSRLIVEVDPEDEQFMRQVRAASVLKGVSLREWILAAIREKYERDGRA
jgi:hypothetical protein